MSTTIHASLCPPPAKLTAINGFHPTNAAANALRRAMVAASNVAPIAASAATTRNRSDASSGELPAMSATPADAVVNAGPYTDLRSRHARATERVEGSPGKRAGATAYGSPLCAAIRP